MKSKIFKKTLLLTKGGDEFRKTKERGDRGSYTTPNISKIYLSPFKIKGNLLINTNKT